MRSGFRQIVPAHLPAGLQHNCLRAPVAAPACRADKQTLPSFLPHGFAAYCPLRAVRLVRVVSTHINTGRVAVRACGEGSGLAWAVGRALLGRTRAPPAPSRR